MTFEDLWTSIEKMKAFPNTAITHLPDTLTDYTKRRIANMDPDDAVRVIQEAIKEVDKGSTLSIDLLISRKL